MMRFLSRSTPPFARAEKESRVCARPSRFLSLRLSFAHGARFAARLLCLIVPALMIFSVARAAGGVTLRTVSTFAGNDASADVYTHLLAQWEETTGNTVADESSTSCEAWKESVLMDFAAGNEPDVLFFFTCTSDSAGILRKVVPIAEINAAYPGLNLPENAACRETDGKVYAIPVRSYWEGLFCNTDLFAAYDLPMPDTWENLTRAIRVFKSNGVVPIAVSLSDVPHYLAEFVVLASGDAQDYLASPRAFSQVPQSWTDGMALLRELAVMGAFPKNVSATTEPAASQLFRGKKAAMQLDGSWFANSIPLENMDSIVVLPFPSASGRENGVVIGGISMGFYLTRRAWEDPARRDAAVSLMAFLSTGENAELLGGYTFSGALLKSARDMVSGASQLAAPIQDRMDPAARAMWFSLIPPLAEGAVPPDSVWQRVMSLSPFGS